VEESTDSSLLRDYIAGSEAAFTELVRRHVDLVYAAALRMVVDAHFAEDITQATFVALSTNARDLVGRSSISGWLHRTACNLAAKVVRTEMRRRAREQEAFAMQVSQSEPETDWNRLVPVVDLCLASLGESDRAALLLRFFEGKSARDVAEILQLSEEAAQKRISRATERLRRLLTGQQVSLSAVALTTLLSTQPASTTPLGLVGAISAAVGTAAPGGLATGLTIKLLAMTKLKAAVVTALVATTLATPIILQQIALKRQRDQNVVLQQKLTALGSERDELSGQLAAAQQARDLPRAQMTELMRLRSEVGPLRRDSQELARIRIAQPARPVSADASKEPEAIPNAAWANVGIATPADSLQTFLWAGKAGETNFAANLMRWQRGTNITSDALELMDSGMLANGLIGGTAYWAKTLDSFRVMSEDIGGDNIARLNIELTDKQGKTKSHTLRFVSEENQWFPILHVWSQGTTNLRASLEMPPEFAFGAR